MPKGKAKNKTGKENILLYGIAAAAVAVFAWAVLSIFGAGAAAGNANYNAESVYAPSAPAGAGVAEGQMDESGMHGAGCGDLTDPANVQHLSHHPDQYADCIKQVSPDIFKQATGTDKNVFMQQNGIK